MSEKKENKILSEQEKAAKMNLLKDDDEFEEFEKQDWGEESKDKQDPSLWDFDWEKTIADDEFSKLLNVMGYLVNRDFEEFVHEIDADLVTGGMDFGLISDHTSDPA
ncbi:hypothetical protein H4219_001966 [Mycoemilia scoparia]|uniref:26S proteasome complex subunit SEM1 n=1 Tax=Mycoemilia scoparia TaxID=417184 RepID=A0A9W8A2D7_9FUNG|nr:hypothetical protein H4219_001966 [Mycoemilia scoparia]